MVVVPADGRGPVWFAKTRDREPGESQALEHLPARGALGATVQATWVSVPEGGPRCEELLSRSAAAARATPDDVTAVLAAIAGFFTASALEPAPPGLPTLRAFQAAQGEVARRWLAERTGLA